jgi:hypothetical protein
VVGDHDGVSDRLHLMGLGIMFGWVAFYDPGVHFWNNKIST